MFKKFSLSRQNHQKYFEVKLKNNFFGKNIRIFFWEKLKKFFQRNILKLGLKTKPYGLIRSHPRI